jgi:hypothetical protein
MESIGIELKNNAEISVNELAAKIASQTRIKTYRTQ